MGVLSSLFLSHVHHFVSLFYSRLLFVFYMNSWHLIVSVSWRFTHFCVCLSYAVFRTFVSVSLKYLSLLNSLSLIVSELHLWSLFCVSVVPVVSMFALRTHVNNCLCLSHLCLRCNNSTNTFPLFVCLSVYLSLSGIDFSVSVPLAFFEFVSHCSLLSWSHSLSGVSANAAVTYFSHVGHV